MLPSPLHPAVVHFPIVLMFLLPLAGLTALWWIRRGSRPLRAWMLPVLTAAALAGSSWLAVESGESEEDRAENVAGEAAVSRHEHAAERFMVLTVSVLGLAALGLVRGRIGVAARWSTPVAAVVLILAGYQVGHSGGQLVYGDGNRPGLVSSALSTDTDRDVHEEDREPEDREE